MKVATDITSDHIFPKSWYPNTTPANLEKWQAPACQKCNAAYGRLEEEMLMKLGMCLDSDAPGSAGLGQKALNAMNPRRGRNAKDAAIRFRKARQLLSESIVLPGQIEPDAIEILNPGPASLGTSISRKDFDRIAEKIVRGITWVVNQKLVDACYEIRVSSSPKPNPEFDAIVIQHGSRYDRGPGIVVYYAKATDDPIAAFFLVRLFDQIDLRATIAPTGTNARPQT